MNCEKVFYSNADTAINTFMGIICHKTNRNLEIIKPIIKEHLIFKIEDHGGAIKPSYYCDGIPQVWICTKCREEIT